MVGIVKGGRDFLSGVVIATERAFPGDRARVTRVSRSGGRKFMASRGVGRFNFKLSRTDPDCSALGTCHFMHSHMGLHSCAGCTIHTPFAGMKMSLVDSMIQARCLASTNLCPTCCLFDRVMGTYVRNRFASNENIMLV